MATDFWDMFNQFIKGQLKVGTGANAVTLKPTLNPFQAAANLQSVYETAKQQSIKTGGNAGGDDALQNPVIKGIANLVATERAKNKKQPRAFGSASNPAGQQTPSVQGKPQFQADMLQNPVIKSIANLVATERVKNQKQPGVFWPVFNPAGQQTPSVQSKLQFQSAVGGAIAPQNPVNPGPDPAKLNIKQKIMDSGQLDYTQYPETRRAVVEQIGLSPDASPADFTRTLENYLVQHNDQLPQNGYGLTLKNLDTIFGSGSGDASRAGEAAQPKQTTPLPYQDSAKKAGVTSGFNGSGLMREDMKMPDLSSVSIYDLYDHGTLNREASADVQNRVRQGIEYIKQKAAADRLKFNEADAGYYLAKTANSPDVNEWQKKYVDALAALEEDDNIYKSLTPLLQTVQKNQQLAQQANFKNNADFGAEAAAGMQNAAGVGRDAYIAGKAVPTNADNMKYFTLTPEERETYFYIKSTQGNAIANRYMDDLNSSLVMRMADIVANVEASNPLFAGAGSFAGGANNWLTDILQTGSNLFGNRNPVDPGLFDLAAQMTQGKVTDPTYRNVLQGLYTAGQVAPDVATAFIPAVGEGAAVRIGNTITKLGDAGKVAKGEKILNEARKIVDTTGDIANSAEKSIIDFRRISGALDPDSKAAEIHANKYYGLVRSMKTDVAHIAQNTKSLGFDEQTLTASKRYLFIDKHDLATGFKQFDPNYEIAQSWQRLIQGGKEIREQDILLLQHEKMEMELMQKGYTQDEAHILASEKYDYSELIK